MYKHLISEQRSAIYLMLQKEMSQKDIAAAIGVSPPNYYKGSIVTIIDRSTDWLIMRKLPHGKDAFADPHAPWQKVASKTQTAS